jgi:hypothetical protein
MADTAMVKTSRLDDWLTFYQANGGVRFCANGHLNANVADPQPARCDDCGCEKFATFRAEPGAKNPGSTVVPVPPDAAVIRRKWRAVEAYGRSGFRLAGVYQRYKAVRYDVSAVPAEKWKP